MTKYPGITALVQNVVRGATIEPEAPREPRDERVAFPTDVMAKLFKSVGSPDRLNAAIGDCEAEMRYQLMDRSDVEHSLAALLLRNRLEAPPARGYVEGVDGLLKPL